VPDAAPADAGGWKPIPQKCGDKDSRPLHSLCLVNGHDPHGVGIGVLVILPSLGVGILSVMFQKSSKRLVFILRFGMEVNLLDTVRIGGGSGRSLGMRTTITLTLDVRALIALMVIRRLSRALTKLHALPSAAHFGDCAGALFFAAMGDLAKATGGFIAAAWDGRYLATMAGSSWAIAVSGNRDQISSLPNREIPI
jgi:hypothetical protein